MFYEHGLHKIKSYKEFVLIISTIFFIIIVFSILNIVKWNPYTNINVYTANKMITNGSFPYLIILDVRTQSEYDTGHLENSILIPVDQLEQRINELIENRENEIIVYCRTGRRSADASEILEANNFLKVFNVLGGITAWEESGYPVIPEFSSWMILPILGISIMIHILRKRVLEDI